MRRHSLFSFARRSVSGAAPVLIRHGNSPVYSVENIAHSGLPCTRTPFLVLGIETSCDDTAAAVVRSDGTILSNIVASQHQLHENFGGVVPSLAMQAHQDRIDAVVAQALAAAGLASAEEVDGIAVTRGPGLEICLRVGLRKAQDLARLHAKPLVAVHHLEAHSLIARVALEEEAEAEAEGAADQKQNKKQKQKQDRAHKPGGSTEREAAAVNCLPHFRPKVEFPFLTFLASGGHTSLLLCRELGKYEVLGATIDDALGEALDKAARLLHLSSSFSGGGAAVELAARGGQVTPQSALTVPLLRQKNCDFSFSGLKNGFRMAVLRAEEQAKEQAKVKEEGEGKACALSTEVVADLCAGFQEAAFRHAEDRLYRAMAYLEDHREQLGVQVRSLVISGGVAANQDLRRRLMTVIDNTNEELGAGAGGPWRPFFPPPRLCTDNGVMVAWAGVELFCRGVSSPVPASPEEQRAGEHEPLPRWALGLHVNRNNNAVFRKRVRR